MFKIFKSKNKRLIEQTSGIVTKILELLPDDYEKLKHSERLTSIINVLYVPNPDSGTVVTIQSQYKSNSSVHTQHNKLESFELRGIEVRNKKTNEVYEIILPIWHGIISNICFKEENIDILNFDIESININNLSHKELSYKNPEVKKLKKLLKDFGDKALEKLEIEKTFEIETDINKYFTIIDMENGNYIAIDSKKRVFRLSSDMAEPEIKIFNNIADFLQGYTGNKVELDKYFS